MKRIFKFLTYSLFVVFCLASIVYIGYYGVHIKDHLWEYETEETNFLGETYELRDYEDESSSLKSLKINENLTINCEYDSNLSCFKNNESNRKSYLIDSTKYALFKGDDNVFIVNTQFSIYFISLDNLEIINTIEDNHVVSGSYQYENRIHLVFSNGLLKTYDDNYSELNESQLGSNKYINSIDIVDSKLIVYDYYKITLFNLEGEYIRTLLEIPDILNFGKGWKVSYQPIIVDGNIHIFYGMPKVIEIENKAFNYIQLHQKTINLETYEIISNDIIQIGYSEPFILYLPYNVFVDNNKDFILCGKTDADDYKGYNKSSIIIVKTNTSSDYIGSKVYELNLEYSVLKELTINTSIMKENQIQLKGHYDTENEENTFTINTQNDNWKINMYDLSQTRFYYLNLLNLIVGIMSLVTLLCMVSYIIVINVNKTNINKKEGLSNRILNGLLVSTIVFSMTLIKINYNLLYFSVPITLIVLIIWNIKLKKHVIIKSIFQFLIGISFLIFMSLSSWVRWNILLGGIYIYLLFAVLLSIITIINVRNNEVGGALNED